MEPAAAAQAPAAAPQPDPSVAIVTTEREIDVEDLMPYYDGEGTVVSVDGTYRWEVAIRDEAFVGLTAAEVATLLGGSPRLRDRHMIDGAVVEVEVTRANPAYGGPDVLFGDPPQPWIVDRWRR